MSDVASVLKLIKEEGIEFVELRFTDTKGKWQHTAQTAVTIDESVFEDGLMFDGSSIAGWKDINESDMILMPDAASAVIDPFAAQPTLVLFCDIVEPSTGEGYDRDPRSLAKRADAYMKSTGIGDTFFVGPEPEFFIFDDVKFITGQQKSSYELYSPEMPYTGDFEMEAGNLGHRPRAKGGYFPVAPVDSAQDLRAEICTNLDSMGLKAEKHHHEVAPAQHELGFALDTFLNTADAVQIYKYCVTMTAHQYGKTATFMPKPMFGDNGSGMHCHQSIWKDGKPLFAGNGYADLSDMCLYYIGGIIKHAKAINAFTNPTTNSYKRLVPGYEAPVLLAYSARNRSASCRIPYGNSPKAKRVEVRFPDALANPYLAISAMLMAGLDGIENKIHPGEPMDKDLYALPPEELAGVPTVCGSLREALEALDADRDFLKKGDVFSDSMIDAYIELKMQEVIAVDMAPHPLEFDMYYSG